MPNPASERARRTGRRPAQRAIPQPTEPAIHDPVNDSHENGQRYFDLYSFAPVTYIRLDQHGVVEEINQAGCQMITAMPDVSGRSSRTS